ncbi:MAG: hypothetical protein KatS3mg111_2332 [Pirellulaceae bacterium]|nr:MAG: hypothetical protein KatS3mg111_2332 [Pirellulaceae bacterium]
MSDAERTTDDWHGERGVTSPRCNPAAKWICGYQHLGITCPSGPQGRGKCGLVVGQPGKAPSLASMDASAAENDELLREMGPCIPRRSPWHARYLWALNLGILAAGAILVGFNLPVREAIFVPGPLSPPHAQILSGRALVDRCGQCHPQVHGGTATATQDQLCLKCHDQHLPDAGWGTPHDLSDAMWHEVLHRRLALTRQLDPTQPAAASDHQIHRTTRCADCHREHHGAAHRLTTMTDAQCQTCHAQRFASFAHGHPEFRNYPYRMPQSIRFDHRRHHELHFARADQAFTCQACHVDDQRASLVGHVFRTLDFETTCSQCHAAGMRAEQSDGWVALAIPSIAPDDMDQHDSLWRTWPEHARFGFEGTVSFPLRVLLAADPTLHPALAQLPSSGRIEDVPQARRAEVGLSLARGIHQCIDDLVNEGQAAWRRRLTSVLTDLCQLPLHEPTREILERATSGIPSDLFDTMRQQWFVEGGERSAQSPARPSVFQFTGWHLQEDLFEFGDGASGQDPTALFGEPPVSGPANGKRRSAADRILVAGWYLDHPTLSLRYRPQVHADPTLTAWAELAVLLDWAAENDGDHQDAPSIRQILGLFEEGASAVDLPGDCLSCHDLSNEFQRENWWARFESSDERETTGALVTPLLHSPWRSVQRPADVRLFTRFDHRPHRTIAALADCVACHQLAATESGGPSDAMLSHPTSSDFHPMRLEQCASCHHDDAASACTSCHQYHVGRQGVEWAMGGSEAWRRRAARDELRQLPAGAAADSAGLVPTGVPRQIR